MIITNKNKNKAMQAKNENFNRISIRRLRFYLGLRKNE